jgi:uncharacterized membrane protein
MIRTRNLAIGLLWAALVGAAVTVVTSNLFLNLTVGLFAYLVVPGLMIQVAFRRRLRLTLEVFLYGSGLSLAFWMLGGLALDVALPVLGDAHPLSTTAMLGMYLISMVALAGKAWWSGADSVVDAPLPMISGWANIVLTLSLAGLPIMSLLGSSLLNKDGSGIPTKLMIGLMALLVAFVAFNAKRIEPMLYAPLVFSFGASLLLMYSMRSYHILGWDVSDELRVYTTTLQNQRWRPSYYPGQPYNACLSITILPTILEQLMHVPFEYVYKFVFQVIFAVFPLGVYSIGRRFLTSELALIASLLFCAQTWFFEQMPAVVRQEIAMIFFILIVLLLVDDALTKRGRRLLIYTFVVCLIVSHYSTAYVWLLLALLAYMPLLAYRLTTHHRRGQVSTRLSAVLIAFTVLAMFLWQEPATHTIDHAETVASTGSGTLADAFSPSVLKEGIQQAFLPPASVNTTTIVRRAERTAVAERTGPASHYYPPSSYSTYQVHSVNDTEDARDYFPSIVSRALTLLAYLLKALVENLMTLVGIVFLVVAMIRRRRWAIPDFVFLSVAAYLVILAELLLPYLQQNYNLTRLYLQMFSILAIPSVLGFSRVLRRYGRWATPVIGVVIGVILVSRTGLLDQFTGGPLRITMSQPQGTFDTFYVYDSEVYAARWLALNRDIHDPVYADSVADLRLEAYANLDAYQALFPATLSRSGYVYEVEANVTRGHAFYSFENDTLVYNYPQAFLNANKDLIYNAGTSRVYK